MFGIINVIGLAFKPLAKFQAVIRVDVIVDSKNLTDKEIAQIEDIVKRKTGIESVEPIALSSDFLSSLAILAMWLVDGEI